MKSIIDISKENYYLSFKDNHLVIKEDNKKIATIHISTIDAIVVHSPSITYSQKLLVEIAKQSIPLIICNEYHLPIAQMFYYDVKYAQGTRLNLQLSISRSKANAIWKEIVKLKVKEQANLLKQIGNINYKKLEIITKNITTGDKSNMEGQAANIYFKSLFSKNFKRERNSLDIINASLNYGYTVVRSAVARAIFASSLNPSIGIFHKNTVNPFCLVDDLIEPFRIIVDGLVYKNYNILQTKKELDPETKQILVSLLSQKVILNKQEVLLSDSILKFVYSYINALETKATRFKLNFPEKIEY